MQAVAAKRMEVTIDSLAKELEEARLIAIAEKQAAAAVSATMGKAKLFGFGVENKRISGPGGGAIPVEIDLSKVSNEQLDALEALFGKIAGGSGGDDDGDPSGEAEAGG
ncbi:hypothetical protein QO014_002367 [Kaistia dalseonensis]|uniref:Uncharacterized protein n=1 Tax=Kaistia dalseonensis TaxID=410840 RepID=A0ABU0H6N4_9HYPH|nr:hypothetical protein [Kaistia dalseonensis]